MRAKVKWFICSAPTFKDCTRGENFYQRKDDGHKMKTKLPNVGQCWAKVKYALKEFSNNVAWTLRKTFLILKSMHKQRKFIFYFFKICNVFSFPLHCPHKSERSPGVQETAIYLNSSGAGGETTVLPGIAVMLDGRTMDFWRLTDERSSCKAVPTKSP